MQGVASNHENGEDDDSRRGDDPEFAAELNFHLRYTITTGRNVRHLPP